MLSNRARLLIVMEMMEGGELFHRISQHRHFTEKQASQVTKQASQRWWGGVWGADTLAKQSNCTREES